MTPQTEIELYLERARVALAQGRGKHAGVHSTFGLHFVRSGLIEPEYGRMLVNAFNLRVDSDYEVLLSVSKDLAEDVLRDAERFVERSATYLRQEGYL